MRKSTISTLAFVAVCLPTCLIAAEPAKYLLESKISAGAVTDVIVSLEVGGDLITRDAKAKETKLPSTVDGRLEYQELIVAASPGMVRALRKYDQATATIEFDGQSVMKSLPEDQQLIAADLRDGQFTMNGCVNPLTREQLDLIDAVGNSLAIDQLLPGREMAEGEKWEHESTTLGSLLGMDHVAVCDVSSVIVGHSKNQVQIKLGGTVHGTIDGTTTEIELRGAYLFHQRVGRITKFNLAIKENRAVGEVIPGLDVIAKAKVMITPAEADEAFTDELVAQTSDISQPLRTTLLYEAREKGFQFQHEPNWFVTAEQRDLLSLRCLQGTDFTSHCNITTLPARSAGRGTTLDQFKEDIQAALGENLAEISAATQWTTSQGHECLGVIANGKINDVEVQWRYYLVSSADLPRVTLAVTVEGSQLEQFADADRELVESLVLFEPAVVKTAGKDEEKSAK